MYLILFSARMLLFNHVMSFMSLKMKIFNSVSSRRSVELFTFPFKLHPFITTHRALQSAPLALFHVLLQSLLLKKAQFILHFLFKHCSPTLESFVSSPREPWWGSCRAGAPVLFNTHPAPLLCLSAASPGAHRGLTGPPRVTNKHF